jgi:hypothetical protein
MTGPSDHLRVVLVDAFPPYLEHRLRELGVDPGLVGESVERGAAWLESELTDLLAQPFHEQRRGPLEVFQEAMRFPTEALADRGVPPAERDGTTVRILPGDHYDLAPASSSVLGERVWTAHLAWGAAKAKAMTDGEG